MFSNGAACDETVQEVPSDRSYPFGPPLAKAKHVVAEAHADDSAVIDAAGTEAWFQVGPPSHCRISCGAVSTYPNSKHISLETQVMLGLT